MNDLLVRALERSEQSLHRSLRLRALASAPETFAETREEAGARGHAYWEEQTRAVTPPARQRLFIASTSIGAVGCVYALLDARSPTQGRLGGMWVDPTSRRRGVGVALSLAVIEWARAQQLGALALWAPERSVAARTLYRRVGFEETGSRSLYTRGDGRQLSLCELAFQL